MSLEQRRQVSCLPFIPWKGACLQRVPAIRIRDCNGADVRPSGKYVLYWMIANRRVTCNFALDRAIEHCREMKKPLVIFEALRCGYEWASDRMHRFVIDGMADNAAACKKAGVTYFPYVEPKAGDGHGLLEALSRDACVAVTDEYPCFFLPRMVAAAAKNLKVRLEAVDSCGMLPLRAADRIFTTAHSFRRFLQKTLPQHLEETPAAEPLKKARTIGRATIPREIFKKWPAAPAGLLAASDGSLATFPIDHEIAPSSIRGGEISARKQMKHFLEVGFLHYGDQRNEPEKDVQSGLSPYLHFGFISVHEVFAEIVRRENWTQAKLAVRAHGSRAGWWNMSANAEGFLDEIITWREVGYNFSSHSDKYDDYNSLPAWALKTLKQHAKDEREHRYSLEELEQAKTYDALWNAAQVQLVREGRIHNYLRMLWGKKILEWSRTPQDALRVLIQLNNKYGLDGRDPNSYSGIFWCLGRYDRAWGPERPIFGKVRYMSSENTARKVSVKNYIKKYSPPID
jgi:deoxyribodipyrimidine photo-lyase